MPQHPGKYSPWQGARRFNVPSTGSPQFYFQLTAPMKPTTKLSLATLAAIPLLSLSALAADDKEADNTKKNERDKSGATATPGDQSNAPEDLKITQNIRRAVMKDKSLTLTAKNVKIITAGGQVTLRGPVVSPEEKKKIEDLAAAAAGKDKVISQLEVKAPENK